MDMVVRETLRLCAPVQAPVAQRGLTQPLQCGKYTLLPGGHSGRGRLGIQIWIGLGNLCKKYWGANAEDFVPERFEMDKMKNFHPFQYVPFGGGRRLCIGNLFAITQAKTLLSMILRSLGSGENGLGFLCVALTATSEVKLDPKDICTPLTAERGGGVWLQFTSRDYDEPDTPASLHPTHGELCRSFLQESERIRPGGFKTFISCRSFCPGRPLPPLSPRWGGEFRTTHSAAQDLAKTAESRGFTVELKPLDEASGEPVATRGSECSLPIVTPLKVIPGPPWTTSQPRNAGVFCKALASLPDAEEGEHFDAGVTHFSSEVGNSQWVSTFVKACVAKEVDKHLARTGATRVLPFEVADKNDCFDKSVRAWKKAGRGAIRFPAFAARVTYLPREAVRQAVEEELQLETVASGKATDLTEHFLRHWSGYQNCKISVNKDRCGREAVRMTELCLQTMAESPSVRQILVERPDGTPYACGDHLEVRPKNSMAQAGIVMRACMRLGCQSDSLVLVKVSAGEDGLPQGTGQTLTIGDILTYFVDLQALPSQETLASLLKLASKSQEAPKTSLWLR
eukprot:Skav234211  [mRNA]  locus=scaffold2795:162970:174506:- [translate_table: standard]